MGTAEFYTVVEEQPEVEDSLVIHIEDPEGGPGELLLFVQLKPGLELDDELRSRLGAALRSALSPRHVPDTVEAVPSIPRTLTGKKLEAPVKRILRGADADSVASRGALLDPRAIDAFVQFSEGKRRRG
jgi:acetoacetyl-CoA synthetase